MVEVGRPEELMINRYLGLRTGTGNIAGALGFLALFWSTVVLLGGFVSNLLLKEFWVVTALSFLMSFRLVEIATSELKRGIYFEEIKIIDILRRQKWRAYTILTVLRLVQALKLILGVCFVLLYYGSPFVSLGLSLWRLARRDYGHAGGEAANRAKLAGALDIFYALVSFQSLWAFYYIVIDFGKYNMILLTTKNSGLSEEEWGLEAVQMYYSETKRKLNKDGKLPDNWNLITYGVGLLQSLYGDDHVWGARVLDKLFDKDVSVRQHLLSSRLSIQNLISMIGWRGTCNIENRKHAARIVAHLASDLHMEHFPGILQCICSLLESSKKFCGPENTSENNHEQRLPENTLVRIRDSHIVGIYSRSPFSCLAKCFPYRAKGLISEGLKIFQEPTKFSNGREIKTNQSLVFKTMPLLITQGLQILEGLTRDEEHCTKISRHQRLVSKITSALSSHDFLINVTNKTMVQILSKSLTVVRRLLTCSGDGATRLRQELASNTEALSNLMDILETDSEGAQELCGQALEILTELAFDDSFKKLDFNKLLKSLVRIFLGEKANNTHGRSQEQAQGQRSSTDNTTGEEARETPNSTVPEVTEETERDPKTTRLRGKAGEALARLLLVGVATDANKLSKQEAIDLLTKVLHQILSGKLVETKFAVNEVAERIADLNEFLYYTSSKTGTVSDETIRAAREVKPLVNEVLRHRAHMGTATDVAKGALTKIENLPVKVFGTMLNIKKETIAWAVSNFQLLIQRIEKQYDEIKFMAAMLSLTVVICNENVISKEDFARASPDDEALVKKLQEILLASNQSTAECLGAVKLTCQVAIALIKLKPSCIQHFNKQNFKQTLTEALDTMSEIDDCMLFAGNDREVIKPARSLAFLVKEVQELLTPKNSARTG